MMVPTTKIDTNLFLNKNKKKAKLLYLNYINLFSIRTNKHTYFKTRVVIKNLSKINAGRSSLNHVSAGKSVSP